MFINKNRCFIVLYLFFKYDLSRVIVIVNWFFKCEFIIINNLFILLFIEILNYV